MTEQPDALVGDLRANLRQVERLLRDLASEGAWPGDGMAAAGAHRECLAQDDARDLLYRARADVLEVTLAVRRRRTVDPIPAAETLLRDVEERLLRLAALLERAAEPAPGVVGTV